MRRVYASFWQSEHNLTIVCIHVELAEAFPIDNEVLDLLQSRHNTNLRHHHLTPALPAAHVAMKLSEARQAMIDYI